MTDSLQVSDLFPEQNELITRICSAFNNGDFFQSYLIVGVRHLISFNFVQNLVKNILCVDRCGTCRNCNLIDSIQHPDYIYVTNLDSNIIKIDSIRELQSRVYQSLSIAKYKIVVIHPADKLNIQAASALLKILEEPPMHTIFILVAENIKALPVTIVSRCHKYFMHDYSLSGKTYFDIAKFYPENDERFILMSKVPQFLTKLIDLTINKTNVCEIAADFQEFKLENVLWFFYLLTAATLKIMNDNLSDSNYLLLKDFSKTQNVFSLHNQLDKINSLLKTNVTLNNNLCVANILLGYKSC